MAGGQVDEASLHDYLVYLGVAGRRWKGPQLRRLVDALEESLALGQTPPGIRMNLPTFREAVRRLRQMLEEAPPPAR